MSTKKSKVCINCQKTKYVNYAGPKCVNCYRKDNPEIVKRISEQNKARPFTSSYRFSAAKRQAKERGLPWNISKEAYLKLNTLSCFYCGGPLPEKGTGLDRINNDKNIGYTEDNVVPCCTTCNSIRGNKLSLTETLAAVSAVKERKIEAIREYHENGVHLDLRKIMISGPITNNLAENVIKGIEELENINSHAPIVITIMSDGGDWSSGLAVYEKIKDSSCPIITVGTGRVCSIATIIMQAGTIRLITPLCTLMIHDGSDGYEGDPRSFEAWAVASKKSRKLMYEIYAKRSKQPIIHWETACGHDTVYFGSDVIDIGLADKILEYGESPTELLETFSEQ